MLAFITKNGYLQRVVDVNFDLYSGAAQEARRIAGEVMHNRNDFANSEVADSFARAATAVTGRLHIATDSGEYVSPRYDVIEAPVVGAAVSRSFNGDSYPAGNIVSISKSLKRIVTSDGTVFFRRRNSGAWVNHGTWSMIPGHVSEWNPSF
jgi:hypothetical protein